MRPWQQYAGNDYVFVCGSRTFGEVTSDTFLFVTQKYGWARGGHLANEKKFTGVKVTTSEVRACQERNFQGRQFTCINTEVRSRNHCCRGKAISITQSKCVSVALVIQHAKCTRRLYCQFRPVRLYNIVLHYLINGRILGGKTSLNIWRVF